MEKRIDKAEHKRIFDEWLDRHKGLFFKIVRTYATTSQDRDDLFQEISIQVWNSVPHFRGDASVATWIYRVALYTAMAWTRGERKHKVGKRPLSDIEPTLMATEKLKDSRLEWLYEQIGQLNDIDRSLTLLLLDGFSYKEMAAILGISESNVGVKINRIKKRLTAKSQETVTYGV